MGVALLLLKESFLVLKVNILLSFLLGLDFPTPLGLLEKELLALEY
jgi:hypothetical protein